MLSFVIVNFNSSRLVKSCVESIKKWGAGEYEIIVVDNTSREEDKNELRKIEGIKIIELSINRGYAAGINCGVKASKGEYTVLMNPDVVFQSPLDSIFPFFNKNPRAGAVGIRLLNRDGTIQQTCFSFPNIFVPLCRRTFFGKTRFGKMVLEKYTIDCAKIMEPRKVDWIMGACVFMRREVFEKIGGMDERYFLYFEDIDLCKSLWRAWYEVWHFPQVVATHQHKRISAKKGFNRYVFIHIWSGIKYFMKWFFKK